MAISNDVLSSTLRILLDEEVDQLYQATPLLDKMRERGGVVTYDGGQKLNVPLILEEHSSITQLDSGYEPVNLAVKDALRQAEFNWCDFVAPIVVTRSEELSNKGERAIIDIAEARMKSVMGALKREVEKQVLANASTVLTNLNTFNAMDDAVAASTNGGGNLNSGFFQNRDFGTQVSTSVGGLSKVTFPRLNNQYVTAGGTLTIAQMTDLYIDCQLNTPDGSAPDLIICSPQFYKAYKALLFAQERFVDEKVLDGGRLALAFNGALVSPSPFLGSTVQNPTATPTGTCIISAYFLNSKYMKIGFDSAAQFEMDDFESVSGYASRSANIYTRLQIYFEHLASQGVLVNGEA
tara:strand:- start:6223 stop:7275 length:1053 start_codon:yes stop_codon:yes gene_type:complete